MHLVCTLLTKFPTLIARKCPCSRATPVLHRYNLGLAPEQETFFGQDQKRYPQKGYPRIGLVAPYCAIPRDYLSDTPLLRAMGFLVSQHGQLGAIPLPPFLSVSPLENIREVEVRCPPSKGVSQRYLRDTL